MANNTISQAAIDLIVGSEVGSKQKYEQELHKPVWPQGQSGVTIGIGYDVGHATKEQLSGDWTGVIPDTMIAALEHTVGVTGDAAKALAEQLGAVVDVPWDAAMSVFLKRDVPKWIAIVEKALPNTDSIGPDCLGALVSLSYNRGASYSQAGDRYNEMRAIKDHMANRQFTQIPDDLRSMKRLWPNLPGLQNRREREAQLFEKGLASLPSV